MTQATPFQCRLRDCTYSAPIYVNVRYTRGRQIVVKKKVMVGDPSYAFNQRNHTQHLSLNRDFESRVSDMKTNDKRKFSVNLSNIQLPRINEYEPLADDVSSLPDSCEDYAS